MSYIGCAISLACLIATIVFFAAQGYVCIHNECHYLCHLEKHCSSLFISLFISILLCHYFADTLYFLLPLKQRGTIQYVPLYIFINVCFYIIFLKGGCAFVAALLQYFFLSSFCWMLCEGVMLYLMLVKVFSAMAKRWYFFLILGWGKWISH